MSKGSDAATVGNINVEDRCGPTSNFGPCVTLDGPGENITNTWIGSSSATGVLPGTYIACKHIAGLMAVLFVHDPSLRFDTKILYLTWKPIGCHSSAPVAALKLFQDERYPVCGKERADSRSIITYFGTRKSLDNRKKKKMQD